MHNLRGLSEHRESFALLTHTAQESDGRRLWTALPLWVRLRASVEIAFDAIGDGLDPHLLWQIVFGGLLCGLGDEDRFPQRRKVFAQVAGEQSERAWIWFDRGMECGHHGRRIMHDERLVAQ